MTVRTAPQATRSAPSSVTGVRLHRRSPVDAAWLVRSVLPVLRRLSSEEGADVVYVRPGWLHGPHVDVVARPAAGGAALPWEDVAARLDAGPHQPDSALDEAAYLAQARELGRLEDVPPPYLPMRPHGTVEWLAEQDVPSWPAPLGALRELVLTRMCSPLALTAESLTAEPGGAPRRLTELFVALADAHRWGAAYGVFSLRSHAEAFLTWAAPAADPRPAFDRRLERDAPELREVVEQALSGRSGPHVAAWSSALAHGTGVLDAAVACGALDSAFVEGLAGARDGADLSPPGGAADQVPGMSAFHRRIEASGVTDAPPDWFTSYRVLLNLAYQQLPLLGLPPIQRYYYCYAVASTVDEVLGESWDARLGRVERMAAGAAR